MSEILKLIILGLVQGLTEFLPVSSSGHLMLLQDIFGIHENVLFNTIILHLGTLFAVILYYFKDLTALLQKDNRRTILLLVVATIPACIIGLIAGDIIENFGSIKLLAFTFFFTATILFVTTYYKKTVHPRGQKIGLKTACVMGLCQCAALLPGISRSGLTISGGIFAKSEPKNVIKFSFFMSIPIILGSLILELFKVNFECINWAAIILGLISSFLSGLLAIKVMTKLAERCNFKGFGVYLLLLSFLCFTNEFLVVLW